MTPVIAIQNHRRLVIGRGGSTCSGVGTPIREVVVVIWALESSGGVASSDGAGDGDGAGAGVGDGAGAGARVRAARLGARRIRGRAAIAGRGDLTARRRREAHDQRGGCPPIQRRRCTTAVSCRIKK